MGPTRGRGPACWLAKDPPLNTEMISPMMPVTFLSSCPNAFNFAPVISIFRRQILQGINTKPNDARLKCLLEGLGVSVIAVLVGSI
eukprot:7367790-Ditylum_brightwellii.AAC.1